MLALAADLKRVQAGEAIQITSCGRVIVRLQVLPITQRLPCCRAAS